MANFGKNSNDNTLGSINVTDVVFNGPQLRERLREFVT